ARARIRPGDRRVVASSADCGTGAAARAGDIPRHGYSCVGLGRRPYNRRVPQTSLQFPRIDLRGRLAGGESIDYGAVVPRAEFDIESAVEAIRPVVEDVAARGLPALEKFSEEFDRVVPHHFRVPEAELARAAYQLDPELRVAFQESIRRRREVCVVERGEPEATIELAAGARVSQRLIPVDRVGLYVPGGRRSEEHTSELQSRENLVCRLLLEKKKRN